MVYTDFEAYSKDAESLVTRNGKSFDYVEGFMFVNNDDPVNGWPSVLIDSTHEFYPKKVQKIDEDVLYCLEMVLHYNRTDHFSTIDLVR